MNVSDLDVELIRHLQSGGNVAEEELVAAIRSCCDSDEQADLDENGLDEFITQRLSPRTILSFTWESWGAPTSSSGWIQMAHIGSHQYLILPDDFLEGTHPLFVLGAAEVAAGSEATSQLVAKELAALFGDVFGPRLPTSTSNSAPDLVSRAAVRSAYWTAAQSDETWQELAADLERLILNQAVDFPDFAIAVSARDEATRTRLFDAFFNATYS